MWSTQEELLAQLIEEVSLMVADHRRRKPRQVTRPWDASGGKGLKHGADKSVQATGMAAVLAATQGGGQIG